MNPHRRARLVRTVVLMVVASALLVVWVLPLIWAFVVSLKSEREVLAYPPSVVFDATWSNYVDSLFGDFSIIDGLLTSAIVSTATTVLTIVLAVPAAYAFARLRLPAKRSLGFYTLATQMVPPVGLVIPYFLILNRFGWLDTYHGMIVVYLTFSLPFAIWLMVSYYVTHDQEEAMTLADRMAVFLEGSIKQVGTPAEVFGQPNCVEVAAFIGSPPMNLIPAHLDGNTLTIEGHSVRLAGNVDRAPGPITAGIRPGHVRIDPAGIPARLYLLENLGETQLLNLKLGEVLVRMRVAQTDPIPEARTIPIAFEPGAVHLFDAETGRRVEVDRLIAG